MSSGVRPRTRVILFVDDDPDLRTLHCGALRRAGFIVDEASGVDEAFDLARTFAPDLVVLDRHLRDGDGWDLARALKGSEATKSTLIVGFSARGMRDDMERALVAGCDAFLEKPIACDALVRHLRGMLALPFDDDALPESATLPQALVKISSAS